MADINYNDEDVIVKKNDGVNHNLLIQTQNKLISMEGMLEGETKRANRLMTRVNNLEESREKTSWVGKLIEKLPAETLIITGIMAIVGTVLIGTLFLFGLDKLGIAMGYMDMFITLIIIWVRDKMNDKSKEEIRNVNNNLIGYITEVNNKDNKKKRWNK